MPRSLTHRYCDCWTLSRLCFLGACILGLVAIFPHKWDLLLSVSVQNPLGYDVDSSALANVTSSITKDKLEAESPIWLGMNLDHLNRSQDGRPAGLVKYFYPVMTEAERIELKKQIQIFMEIAERANLTYMIFFGTLLGSYRHHGLIPWDDDFDVVMDWSQEADIRRAFDLYLPSEYMVFFQPTHWKVYNKKWPIIREELPWRFPYIDVLFFRERNGILFGQRDAGGFIYNRSDVFPVKWRPYWNMQMPVPKNYIKMIDTLYGDNVCRSRPYSHKLEHPIGNKRIECDVLKEFYPFVTHRRINRKYLNETLYLNSTVIHSVKSVA